MQKNTYIIYNLRSHEEIENDPGCQLGSLSLVTVHPANHKKSAIGGSKYAERESIFRYKHSSYIRTFSPISMFLKAITSHAMTAVLNADHSCMTKFCTAR
jgi:hypothetical protein